jgi:hypothetical protein
MFFFFKNKLPLQFGNRQQPSQGGTWDRTQTTYLSWLGPISFEWENFCFYSNVVITFLNKTRVTLSYRGSKKILAPNTSDHLNSIWMWEALPCVWSHNYSCWSWWLLGVCQVQHGSDRWGPIGSTMHSTFLFFIFLVCCMLGEAKVPS